MTAVRDWITRPAAERAQLEADGWRFDRTTVRGSRIGRGYQRETVVVMWRERVPDLFGEAETPAA